MRQVTAEHQPQISGIDRSAFLFYRKVINSSLLDIFKAATPIVDQYPGVFLLRDRERPRLDVIRPPEIERNKHLFHPKQLFAPHIQDALYEKVPIISKSHESLTLQTVQHRTNGSYHFLCLGFETQDEKRLRLERRDIWKAIIELTDIKPDQFNMKREKARTPDVSILYASPGATRTKLITDTAQEMAQLLPLEINLGKVILPYVTE